MDSFTEVWNNVCDLCITEFSSVAYESWVKTLEPVKFEHGTAFLRATSVYHKEIIDGYYIRFIKTAFDEIFGFHVEVEIIVETNEQKQKRNYFNEAITKSYTFDTFVVGPSNRFAYNAALAVAKKPGSFYNPLFLYGSSGLGKTHLLNAICNYIREEYKNMSIVYTQGEAFANEIIEAIHTTKTPAFREKYRETDVLVIDDIQFIVDKPSVQTEFFNTFNTLYENSKQIILSSDRPPKDLKSLDERMSSRFETGLLADVQQPTFETRVTIIRRKAASLDIEIPDIVVQYIANQLQSNVRQLEGIVNKICAYQKLTGTATNISEVTVLISEIKREEQPDPISLDRVISVVASAYDVTPADICSKKQNMEVANARHIFIYVARDVTGLSLKTIGKYVGRDHSTASISYKKVENDLKKNPLLRNSLDDIIKNITG